MKKKRDIAGHREAQVKKGALLLKNKISYIILWAFIVHHVIFLVDTFYKESLLSVNEGRDREKGLII